MSKRTPIKSVKTPTTRTPVKSSSSSSKTPTKSPKASSKTPEAAKKSSTTPTVSTKRKSSVSPPKSHGKKQKLSTPAKTDLKTSKTTPAKVETPKSVRTARSTPATKTPMVKTPPRGQTPSIKTPEDAIMSSPRSARLSKTPMVTTPEQGSTPRITTPKDAVLESPAKKTPGKTSTTSTKTPKTASKTGKAAGKTPKSVVKTVGRTPKRGTLYSDILKRNLARSGRKVSVARVEAGKVTKLTKKAKVEAKTPKRDAVLASSSTGHVDSPETFLIGNPRNKKPETPAVKSTKTPKSVKVTATKTPKSVVKKTGGRTPARSVKKTLWSEVVKKNLGRTPAKSRPVKVVAVKQVLKKKPAKTVAAAKTPRKTKFSVSSSTGHIDSPAPIVIGKKTKKTEKVVLPKKGRKAEVNKEEMLPDNTDYEGVSDLLQTPGSSTPDITVSSPRSGRKSSEKRYPRNLSVLQTHQRLGTPGSEARRRR